jgi:DNA-binding transcriptional LysR family regulator
MTLEDLRTFVVACETENLSEASRRLGCSQPAVAQHVKRLERELGVKLMTRQARGVAATKAGRRLYEGASAALDLLKETIRSTRSDHEESEGSMAVACTAQGASAYLREPILDLRKRLPGARVRIVPTNTFDQRLEAVRTRRADLALVPLVDPIPDLETRRAFDAPLRLLVPRTDPLARRGDAVRIVDLVDLRYVSLGPETATHRHVTRALRARGIAVETTETVTDATLAILAVEIGHGHTFVPAVEARVAERRGLVKALRVKGLPPLPIGWAARRFAELPRVAEVFLEAVDASVQRMTKRASTR